MNRLHTTPAGFTLIELVVTLTLVSVLALVVVPMYDMTVRHNKESELRLSLRTIRNALDAYKAATDAGYVSKNPGESGFPPDLKTLVEGVDTVQQTVGTTPGGGNLPGVNLGAPQPALTFGSTGTGAGQNAGNASGNNTSAPSIPPHMVFLREVPRDPFFEDQTVDPEKQWNIRPYGAPPDDQSPGADVYDVSSKSPGVGINGVPYKDW